MNSVECEGLVLEYSSFLLQRLLTDVGKRPNPSLWLMNFQGNLKISPGSQNVLADIELPTVDWFALQPQAWKEVSATEDVLDRDVNAKENVINNHPGYVMNN